MTVNIECLKGQQTSSETDDHEPKRVQGITFTVPSDWPIEKRNNAVGPIPIEEYLSLKFKKLEDRVAILEQKVAEGVPVNVQAEKTRLSSFEETLPQTLKNQGELNGPPSNA